MTGFCLLNGAFYTQDPDRPRAMAGAIRQERFVAVGDGDKIRNLIRPGTRVIDLKDPRVLPGLSDAHFHLYDWALGLQRLPLADTFSLAIDRDILAVAPSEIAEAQVVMTVLGGAVGYRR